MYRTYIIYKYTCTCTCIMKINALTVQNPHHKCDWETRMITDKKIIADNT